MHAEGKIWYLPHHGVVHPQKGNLRVVFDCRAEFKGTSLNRAPPRAKSDQLIARGSDTIQTGTYSCYG